MSAPKHWVIVPAAGVGSRMQSVIPKQYLELGERSILENTLSIFLDDPRFEKVIVPISENDQHWASLPVSKHPRIQNCDGGTERVDSVLNALIALELVADSQDWVWVHDAARPCLGREDVDALERALSDSVPGALLAVPVVDTVKRADQAGYVSNTVDRAGLWRAMTPQVFRLRELKAAIERCLANEVLVTDEASAMEYCDYSPMLVAGSEANIKVTRPEDLERALVNLSEQGASKSHSDRKIKMDQHNNSTAGLYPRIGSGFDVHAFEEGDHVVIGGEKIPHAKGLKAHSDGDVLLHALCDALLGALALGDIGHHFPDTDAEWEGADSRALLRAVMALISERDYRVGNVDMTIIAQAPKMAPHIDNIRTNIATDLGVLVDQVGVKATTTEKLGFTGRKEGIACQASALLVPCADENGQAVMERESGV